MLDENMRCMLEHKYNHNFHSFITWQIFVLSYIIVAAFFIANYILVYKLFFFLFCIVFHCIDMYEVFLFAAWMHFISCVCNVCLYLLSFVQEQSILLIAQDQNKSKKQYWNNEWY